MLERTIINSGVRKESPCANSLYLKPFLLLFPIGLGLFLCSAQLLPTLELSTNVIRNANPNYEYFTQHSLAPVQLLTFVFPGMLGRFEHYIGEDLFWESDAFCGVIGLLLALLAVKQVRRQPLVRLLALMAIVALGLALGKYLPGYRLLFHLVPGLATFRVTSRILFLWVAAVSILAGIGADRLRHRRNLGGRFVTVILIIILITDTLLIAVSIIGLDSVDRQILTLLSFFKGVNSNSELTIFDVSSSIIHGLTFVLLFLLFTGHLSRKFHFTTGREVLVCGLLFFELFAANFDYIQVKPLDDYYYGRNLTSFCALDRTSNRLSHYLGYQFQDLGMIWRYENCQGSNDPLILKSYAEFVNFVEGQPLKTMRDSVIFTRMHPLLGELNEKYAIFPADREMMQPHYRLVYKDNIGRIYQNLAFKKRFEWFPFIEWVPDGRRNLLSLWGQVPKGQNALLAESRFKKRLPERYRKLSGTYFGQDNVEKQAAFSCRRLSANTWRLEYHAMVDGFLFAREMNYPGWQFLVHDWQWWNSGDSTPSITANGIFQAGALPKGRRSLTLTYEPFSFRLGLFLSLIAITLTLGLGVALKSRPDTPNTLNNIKK